MSNVAQRLELHWDTVESQYEQHTLFYVGLYGSQNYGLSLPTSDVDTKAILIPSLRALVFDKPVSTYTIAGDGLCTVQDIRSMFNNLYNGSPNFLEILYTDHYLVNPAYERAAEELRDMRYDLANRDRVRLTRMCGGMAEQAYKRFEKHIAGKESEMVEYGYHPKELSTLFHMHDFLSSYVKEADFSSYFNPSPWLRECRLRPIPYEKAVDLSHILMEKINTLVAKSAELFRVPIAQQTQENRYVREHLDDLTLALIRRGFY